LFDWPYSLQDCEPEPSPAARAQQPPRPQARREASLTRGVCRAILVPAKAVRGLSFAPELVAFAVGQPARQTSLAKDGGRQRSYPHCDNENGLFVRRKIPAKFPILNSSPVELTLVSCLSRV